MECFEQSRGEALRDDTNNRCEGGFVLGGGWILLLSNFLFPSRLLPLVIRPLRDSRGPI